MQLISDCFIKKIEKYRGKSGVYKIYSIKNDIPSEIQRLSKVDTSGLLYIGSSKNLKDRLGMLRRVTIGKSDGYKEYAHTFGVKYNSIKKLTQLFPIEALVVIVNLDKDHKGKERRLLTKYLNEHLELPPLNSNYPKQ